MKTTLQDLRKVLTNPSNGSDRHFYGVVKSLNKNNAGKVKSYEVSLGSNDATVTCRKLAGADVGDTVMVTLTKTGMAVVTGTVDGDKDAENALTAATAAQDAVDDLSETVEDIEELVGDGDESGITITTQYYLSTSNTTPTGGAWSDTLPTYVDGRYYWMKTVTTYADGSEIESDPILDVGAQLTAEVNAVVTAENQHFWHDSTGAYVTKSDKNLSSGYAVKITTNGLLQTYNGKNLMSLTSSGLSLYQSDGSTLLASYSSGGVNLYANGSVAASFTTSSAKIYSGTGNYAEMTSSGLKLYNSSNLASVFGAGGARYYDGNGSVIFQISTYRTGQAVLWFGESSGGRISGGGGALTPYLNLYAGYEMINFDGDNHTIKISASTSGYTAIMSGTIVHLKTTYDKVFLPTVKDNTVSTYNLGMGSAYAVGVFSSSRDKKTDISYEIEDEFDPHQLYNLPVVTFRWKDDYKDPDAWDKDRKQIGFIAEDVHDVYYVGAIHDSTGKTIDWSHRTIIPAMLKLIQEQHDEIELLKRRS